MNRPTVFISCVLFSLVASAQTAPSTPDYRSPTEALLPFFQDAIARLSQEHVPGDVIAGYMREAKAAVDGVNEFGRYLIANTLRGDLDKYSALIEVSAAAANKAQQAESEANRITIQEHQNDWMKAAGLVKEPAAETPREMAARFNAETAQTQARVSAQKLEDLRAQLQQSFTVAMQPQEATAQKRILELMEAASAYSRKNGVQSRVTVTTPTEGAVVQFQTYAQRTRSEHALSAKQLTNHCEETLDIGLYYIWTERKGMRTSDPDRLVKITAAEVPVAIAETLR